MKPENPRKGFLLLEVMLTVGILSVGLVFVSRALSTSMRAAKAASNYSRAIDFVCEKAGLIELMPEEYVLGEDRRKEENGAFASDKDFRWYYVLEKFDEYNVSMLEVDVSWKEGRSEGSAGAVTYVRTRETAR